MDSGPLTREGHEGGFTLIEVLVTLSIVSIAFVAILSALSVLITTTATHRRITDGETIVRNVAEFVKANDTAPYHKCENTSPTTALVDYRAKLSAAPPASLGLTSRYSATVVSVEPGTGGVSFGACPGGGDTGIQRVTVMVTPTDATAGQQLTIVKRNPS